MFPECAAEECTATDSGQIIHEMEEIWNSSGIYCETQAFTMCETKL